MSTDEKVTEKKKGEFKKIILVIVVAALVIFVAIFFVARIVTRNAYPRVDRPEFSYQWFYMLFPIRKRSLLSELII